MALQGSIESVVHHHYSGPLQQYPVIVVAVSADQEEEWLVGWRCSQVSREAGGMVCIVTGEEDLQRLGMGAAVVFGNGGSSGRETVVRGRCL